MIYPFVLALLLPWLLLAAGAAWRVRVRNERLRRLQFEGAAMAAVGSAAKWLVHDPNFGVAGADEPRWVYWFDRAEIGLLAMGLIFFSLGLFLERRPRPGVAPWPWAGKMAALAAILGASAIALIALGAAPQEAGGLPWSVSRCIFTVGWYPFAMLYLSRAGERAAPMPHV